MHKEDLYVNSVISINTDKKRKLFVFLLGSGSYVLSHLLIIKKFLSLCRVDTNGNMSLSVNKLLVTLNYVVCPRGNRNKRPHHNKVSIIEGYLTLMNYRDSVSSFLFRLYYYEQRIL